ncbi:MAG: CPBP family intramembrane glutamic endopeptidase [Elusimicrobiota bacterium]
MLWASAMVSTLALFPYLLATGILNLAQLPVPLSTIIRIQLTQSALIYGVAISFGLILAKRVGFGAPYLEAWLSSKAAPGEFKGSLKTAIPLGLSAGLIILVLDLLVFSPLLPASAPKTQFPAWTGFLASFYGAITEELLLRLGFMTLIAWASRLIASTPDHRPKNLGVWTAIILSSIVFGIGHLPATAKMMALTPLVVSRAVILNGIPSVAFGWLYWRHGLEAAMLAHFTADLVLHVIAPAAIP